MPVVSTAVGGVPEIVRDGVNGLLVPPWVDVEAVAGALVRILSEPELARRPRGGAATVGGSTSRSARVYGQLETVLDEVAHG